MKKLLILIPLAISLAGCSSGYMTNEQIVLETKKCEEGGLKAVIERTDYGRVYNVACATDDYRSTSEMYEEARQACLKNNGTPIMTSYGKVKRCDK